MRHALIQTVGIGLLLAPITFGAPQTLFPGEVIGEQKLTTGVGGFAPQLDAFDTFAADVCTIGDLDGDGVVDLAVGSPGDDDGEAGQGAVYIVFLNTDGTAKNTVKISATSGGFTGDLDIGDRFGASVAPLGDLDGDGVLDLAVGANRDDDGGTPMEFDGRGAVWILFMNPDGTVGTHQKISSTEGNFGGTIAMSDSFGFSLDVIGDINDDGAVDIAVGANGIDVAGTDRGGVWIVFLKPDGTVRGQLLIAQGLGGFSGSLGNNDLFGSSVCGIGDFDSDGTPDLAVGAHFSEIGGFNHGSIFLFRLNPNGTVKSWNAINSASGGFVGPLDHNANFGRAIACPGDLDEDGIRDLLVGAPEDGVTKLAGGVFWLLLLHANGSVKCEREIGTGGGGFQTLLHVDDAFGGALASVGDLDGDGRQDMVVGAFFEDQAATSAGALWTLFLDHGPGAPPSAANFGCGVNQPGSLVVVEGTALHGDELVLGLDDPLGLLPPGSPTFLALSGAPSPLYPCGIPIPGWGLSGPNSVGELLIGIGPGELIPPLLVGGPLPVSGMPVEFDLSIPENCTFVGLKVFAQGVIFGPLGALKITEAIEIVIGV